VLQPGRLRISTKSTFASRPPALDAVARTRKSRSEGVFKTSPACITSRILAQTAVAAADSSAPANARCSSSSWGSGVIAPLSGQVTVHTGIRSVAGDRAQRWGRIHPIGSGYYTIEGAPLVFADETGIHTTTNSGLVTIHLDNRSPPPPAGPDQP